MRISEYEKLDALVKDINVLLDSEDTGTRTMFVQEFAKELVKFLGTNDLLGQIDLSKLVRTTTASSDASILFEEGEHKYTTGFGDLAYIIAENHINNPMPARRMTFRGKNLGSIVTDKQLKAIDDGSFEDLFLGDYWEINRIRWRIVDIDYWYGVGEGADKKCWTHHLVIMPDCTISAEANGGGTTNPSVASGYYGSQIRTVVSRDIKAKVIESFSENLILTRNAFCTNAVTSGRPTGYILTDFSVEVPSSISIFGYKRLSTLTNFTDLANGDLDHDSRQFSLFNVAPKNIIPSSYDENGNYGYEFSVYWCRDMAQSVIALVHGGVMSSFGSTISTTGAKFRPVFGLRAPASS